MQPPCLSTSRCGRRRPRRGKKNVNDQMAKTSSTIRHSLWKWGQLHVVTHPKRVVPQLPSNSHCSSVKTQSEHPESWQGQSSTHQRRSSLLMPCQAPRNRSSPLAKEGPRCRCQRRLRPVARRPSFEGEAAHSQDAAETRHGDDADQDRWRNTKEWSAATSTASFAASDTSALGST